MIKAWSALSSDRRWWLALLAAICLALLINPNGYIGGGQDDWQYLKAVRCWRAHGPCLPYDHWQSRWPLIAPIAAITGIFGESRLTVSIAPFLASAVSLFLLAWIGNRTFGRPIGWVGALLFATVPAFTFQLSEPSVEATELALIFSGFAAILRWEEAHQKRWSFAAGLAFSLAFQLRETALVAAVFASIYAATRRPRPQFADVVTAAAAFSIPLLAEFIIFAISTGDPLWRRHLSIAHTQIPSSELEGPIDTKHPPFFNLAYIAHWRREPGIHFHWSVDWLANLLANGLAGLSLSLVPLLAILGRPFIDATTRRRSLTLWAVALGYGAVLTFALAIDPKPRMMLVPLSIASLALALLTWRAMQNDRMIIAVCIWVMAALVAIPLHFAHQRTDIVEGPARRWIAELPGQIEIDQNTRRHLALVPEAQSLPDLDADRPYLLYMSFKSCDRLVQNNVLPPNALAQVAGAQISRMAPFYPKLDASLCLVRYNRPIPGSVMREAIRKSRPDGRFMVGTRSL